MIYLDIKLKKKLKKVNKPAISDISIFVTVKNEITIPRTGKL